ncbi:MULTISPECIES: hypothetical protein [unclassified Nocardia]|uniref:scabin-related ADP-ribosyltransferase n=1 Tax=unclassified Nocardia TaxID=2637762 RepID=UPI00278BD638|nr:MULTISPECIES: hypothetical protein [unclassified Nocardia]
MNAKLVHIMSAARDRLMGAAGKVGVGVPAELRTTGQGIEDAATRFAHEDQELVERFGGISGDARIAGATLRAALDRGLLTYRDLRDYVQRYVVPDMNPESPRDRERLAARTWGVAMGAKLDHLRQQDITGMSRAKAMWEWQDDMERQARQMGEPLPFPDELSRKLPYLRTVYRADKRPPEVIFNEGFKPWGDDTVITPGAFGYPPKRNYVWTSKRHDVTPGYVKTGGHIYVVEGARGAVDMNDHFGPDYAMFDDDEVVFMGGIPADKIKGVLIDNNDPDAGIIPNPNFEPVDTTAIRPPREDTPE